MATITPRTASSGGTVKIRPAPRLTTGRAMRPSGGAAVAFRMTVAPSTLLREEEGDGALCAVGVAERTSDHGMYNSGTVGSW